MEDTSDDERLFGAGRSRVIHDSPSEGSSYYDEVMEPVRDANSPGMRDFARSNSSSDSYGNLHQAIPSGGEPLARREESRGSGSGGNPRRGFGSGADAPPPSSLDFRAHQRGGSNRHRRGERGGPSGARSRGSGGGGGRRGGGGGGRGQRSRNDNDEEDNEVDDDDDDEVVRAMQERARRIEDLAAGRGSGGSGASNDGGYAVPSRAAHAISDSHGSDSQNGNEESGNMYPGYDPNILRIQGDAVHPSNIPQRKGWYKLDLQNVENMKPIRAMCINIPAGLFQRDALNFAQWCLPSNNGVTRAIATAALTSILFAGTAMGMPSGNHAETQRANQRSGSTDGSDSQGAGKKEKKVVLHEVDRYVYIPTSDQRDELPMFRIMYEEIKDSTDTTVTFIRVWLLIFEPTHSTANLVHQVISKNHSLIASQCASGQDPAIRNKTMVAEAERRKKAGFSVMNLHKDFDFTVGMQYTRINSMESYQDMLKLHAGKYVDGSGPMFVPDLDAHIDNPRGRNKLSGDETSGYGSQHPLAPEFVFNAKRKESLGYGMANLDGTKADVHPKYLNPSTYWEEDEFRLPENGDIWMCASVDRRTIMELPLPRPLQNQVVAGKTLMLLFKEVMEEEEKQKKEEEAVDESQVEGGGDEEQGEEEREEEEDARAISNLMDQSSDDASQSRDDDAMEVDGETPDPNARPAEQETEQQPVEVEKKVEITSKDHALFRSFATGRDEAQRQDQESLRSHIQRYDNMDPAVSNSMSNSDVTFIKGDEEGCYRIKIEKMTDRIAQESSRVYSGIINKWYVKRQRQIEDARTALENDCVDPDDERFQAIDKEEEKMRIRLYEAKKDLTQYHLRCLWQCFHSSHDRTTLPSGYKSMVHELESHIASNGGCASMAFPPSGQGVQITSSDRQVWHELQEWLHMVFTKDALIAGRDRFIMISALALEPIP